MPTCALTSPFWAVPISGERRAIRAARVEYLRELEVRDATIPARDGRHSSDGRIVEGVAKSVSTHHTGRAHDDHAFRRHASARSSIQST